jgi:hypothetical protein
VDATPAPLIPALIGLVAVARTREPYFDRRRVLKSGARYDTEFPCDSRDALNQLGSRLRTSTTDDVATRVVPLLRHSLGAWPLPGRRTKVLRRGWRLLPDAAGVWRVRAVNRSRSRAPTVRKVWAVANRATNATPLDRANALPGTLYG